MSTEQPPEAAPETGRDTAQETASPEPEPDHRYRPTSPAFRAFIASGWAARGRDLPPATAAPVYAAQRRHLISAEFAGQRLVLPAGELRTRSNDTDYRFRPHSAFAHLTGLGTDREPDAVLVLQPRDGGGHDAVLYFRPGAGRHTAEFYADARYGELWVGVRPGLAQVAAETGLDCRHLDELDDAITKDVAGDQPAAGTVRVRVVRGADRRVQAVVDAAREAAGADAGAGESVDGELARALSELRLIKDEWEIQQLRLAIEATARGFADIVRALPEAVASPRGERVVETAFESRARREGNGVGYHTIAACGAHACTLHWIRNDGDVHDGDLVLVDAGVEVDSLYTADVTRTLPVSGTFGDAQLRVYQAVLDAADAGFEAALPGARFRDVHDAAMRVIAQRLHGWGLLPGSVEESLDPDNQFHRRWMVHGTSHHLGLDVHDCAQARREMYLDGTLRPGMVFTIEPGLYLNADDELLPPELRGIGVRIEDDVLVTADGCENLSAALPRQPVEIEAWMASLR